MNYNEFIHSFMHLKNFLAKKTLQLADSYYSIVDDIWSIENYGSVKLEMEGRGRRDHME